jgi:hypothetical protein
MQSRTLAKAVMSKKPIPVEEPGDAPAAPTAVDDSDPSTLLQDVVEPGKEVSPPLIVQPTGHLPDAADVDPAKIKTNTLTKQGWVLPTAATAQAAG